MFFVAPKYGPVSAIVCWRGLIYSIFLPDRVAASVHHNNFDPANPIGCIENNPLVPRNCTITRPPPITRPCRSPVVLRPPLEPASVSSLTYTDELLAKVVFFSKCPYVQSAKL